MRIPTFTLPLALCGLALLTLPGQADAASDIPDVSYDLALPPFDIQLRDYQFPSGLRIIFQEEHSQPVVAITNVTTNTPPIAEPSQPRRKRLNPSRATNIGPP